MSYKKDDLGVVFPTRTGDSQGAAAERKMLDAVGGSDGIRKQERIHDDGAVTRLATRAGNPEFITTKAPDKMCWKYSATINSGFVDTTYNFMGVGDTSNEPIRSLYLRDGSVPPDDGVLIKNDHGWKAAFLYGETWGAESSYGGLPSNFSGAMRRLMQIYQGTTKDKNGIQYPVAAGEECPKPPTKQPFSCTYGKTHGVYFSPSGKRWIIEIGSEGIFRVEVTFLREFSSANYAAEETDSVAAAEYWTLTEVKWSEKQPIGVAPTSYALGFAPWYFWCGWAFDSTGSAATNVLMREHPTRTNWLQSAMFDIAISLSGDIPAYAICTMSDVQDLASPVRDTHDGDTANIQAPIDLPGICYTQQIYVYGASGVDAPIFSFYEGVVKQVYRFVVHPTRDASEESVYGDGGPQAFTWSKTGDMAGFPLLPDSDTSTYETQMDGIRDETLVGTRGGGVAGTGTGFPNQNTDEDAYATTVEYVSGPSGFSIHAPLIGAAGGLPAYPGLFHETLVTSVVISADGLSSHSNTTTVLTPDLSGYSNALLWVIPIQVRYTVAGASHLRQSTHKSTVAINGYDRESISLAVTTVTTKASYTRSGTWTGVNRNVQAQGPSQFGGPGCPAPAHVLTPGAPDELQISSTIQLRDGPGYILIETHPGIISGCYDTSGLPGLVCSAPGTIRTIDGTVITVPDFSDTVPATYSTTALLYTRVCGVTEVSSLGSNRVHYASASGGAFELYAGSSAFRFDGTAYFYSKDADEKPTIVGVGSRTLATGRLFGFIGVF